MKIIVDLAGGFGNQLFCYCMGYAVSRRLNARFHIDTSMQDNGIARPLELLSLNVRYDRRLSYKIFKGDNYVEKDTLNKIIKRSHIGLSTNYYLEKNPYIYEPEVFRITTDTYYKGNWESEKYFADYRRELLPMMVPVKERSEQWHGWEGRVRGCCSVSIHVRRGDYLRMGWTMSMDYYDRAICRILESVAADAELFVFSDDLEFCRRYFAPWEKRCIVHYPAYESDDRTLDDLLLMSRCRHNIIANSTYSWWAAWLNTDPRRMIIAPEVEKWSGDLYPDGWILLPAEIVAGG